MAKVFDKKFAMKYVMASVKEHEIQTVVWIKESQGWADDEISTIWVPKPTDEDRFAVCLHEIKHIIDGENGWRYQEEFDCNIYALNILKELKLSYKQWLYRSNWHSLLQIAYATNRGHNPKFMRKDIKKHFEGINFSKWKGKKVVVTGIMTAPGYTVEITNKQ